MNTRVGLVAACLAATGSLSAQVVVYDLHDEVDAGRVRLISATGNGSSSGASVEGTLINDTAAERHFGIYLSRPIYLRNSGAGQSMIATEVYLGDGGLPIGWPALVCCSEPWSSNAHTLDRVLCGL